MLRAILFPLSLLLGIAVAPTTTLAQIAPPFWGTIFIDPDIITPADPTRFQQIIYAGQGTRTMFDRRVPGWITITPYLFNATFDDGLAIEIQINPEFGSSDDALAQAQRFAPVIGRLPTALRADVQTAWIHDGVEPFGGGNNNLLIHTGQADVYETDGILEETFVHEAAHTSLDSYHATSPQWLAGNYPNPFNPSTQIRYTLSERASVTLAVYDAIGRLVDILVNEDQSSGWHTVRFDAADLPAGLYFYRLETGSFSAVKQMTLIR